MEGKIEETPKQEVEVYETGIYVNFYRILSDWGNIEMGSRYFESPSAARRNIDWNNERNAEYLFTAKITDKIFKFEK